MKPPQIFPGLGFAAIALAVVTLAIAQNSRARNPPDTFTAPPPPPPPVPYSGTGMQGARVARSGNVFGGGAETSLDYHDDTAQSRLVALQWALKASLDQLHKAPADLQGGFVESATAELTQALAATDQALARLKTHPESDPLRAIPTRSEMPMQDTVDGIGVSGLALLTQSTVVRAYPTLDPAVRALSPALSVFIDGPYPGASAIIGDLGGSRDEILKNISQAGTDLVAGASALSRAMNPPGARRGVNGHPDGSAPSRQTSLPVPPKTVAEVPNSAVDRGGPALVQPAPPPTPPASPTTPMAPTVTIPFHFVPTHFTTSAAQPGSISGTVADTDGKAANVLISVTSMSAFGGRRAPLSGSFTRTLGLLVTITDETGAFTIQDLPPGSYSITVQRTFTGGYRQAITKEPFAVKAGAQTTLAEPIMLGLRPF